MYRLVFISIVLHLFALVALTARGGATRVRATKPRSIEVDFVARSEPLQQPIRTTPPIEHPASLTRAPSPPVRLTRSLRSPVVARPPPLESLPPAPPSLALAATPTAPPTLTASSLYLTARADVQHIGDVSPPRSPTASPPPRDAQSARIAQARNASQGYVAELVADSNPMEPSHVHEYYSALSRRMRETWRPGFYHTPSMVDALMDLPRRMANVGLRYRTRASSFALTGRPDDPNQPLIPTTFEDRSSFTTRTTSSIVEVEQDETGRVVAMQIVQSARVRSFDEAALAAVRAAFPLQPPMAIPGGRRSRWEFDVAASRDTIVPIAGFMFDESNGFFEMHYPGALHIRTRVRPIGSRPLGVPWPAPHSRLE